jgi:hypothetical protein
MARARLYTPPQARFSSTPNHVVPAWFAQRLGFSLNELRRVGPLVYTDQTWLEVDVADDWRAAVRLAVQDGRVVVSELRVFPQDRPLGGGVTGLWRGEVLGPRAPVPAGGLTSALLRRVRMPRYAAHAAAVVESWRQAVHDESAREALPGVREGGEDRAVPTPARIRGGRPDRFYAELAKEYVRVLATSRRPIADIARRRKLPPAQVRDMIHEARVRALLSEGRQGASGGYLMPRAERLLGVRRRVQAPPRRGRTRRGG